MPNDDIGNGVDHTADRFIGTVVDDGKVGTFVEDAKRQISCLYALNHAFMAATRRPRPW
jgi:hypothetical protein